MWDWLSKAQELTAAGEVFALVTVTSVKGSTPRGPGAKLIVRPDGRFDGTVGGGQLERLVLEDALRCLGEAQSSPRQYPLCFRTGQCCGGAVETFVEVMGLCPILHVFGAGHVGQSLCQTMMGTPFVVHVIDERPEWIQSRELPAAVHRHQIAPMRYVETAEIGRAHV